MQSEIRNQLSSISRWSELDYLRGIGACTIMICHFLYWNYGEQNFSPMLVRSSLYVIPIFYAMSGLTLFWLYHEKILMNQGLRQFLIRRIFRIHPLLILVSVISCTYTADWGIWEFLMNVSGLFGFVKWDHTFATGVWSIGNELFYYLIFPFLILLFSKNRRMASVVLLLAFAVLIWFAWARVHSTPFHPNGYWKNFVNPMNHLFFFVFGVYLGTFYKHLYLNRSLARVIFLLGLSILLCYPSDNLSREFYVQNEQRLFLSLATMMMIYGMVYSQLNLSKWLHRPLSMLGEMSYSIYLIHPIVSHYTTLFWKDEAPEPKILFMIITSLSVSYLIFKFYEKPFIKLGKKLTPYP